MAKYRMVHTNFWVNPIVAEEMTPEDKYFYLYLITNQYSTQIGIYQITKKQIAFDLGYTIETVQLLMERFITHHKLIRYNPETREVAIKNWGKDHIHKAGKPVIDCMYSELKKVQDLSLIRYVSESIVKQEIRSLYESFCGQEEMVSDGENQKQNDRTKSEIQKASDTSVIPVKNQTSRQSKVDISGIINSSQNSQQTQAAKEVMEFWDHNGFGVANVNAKQHLLSWIDKSSFLQPKEIILKAMKIACANNKRRLNYIVGILKNWENESLLTVEEIDECSESQRQEKKMKAPTKPLLAGRAIPDDFFVLDLTAGED